MLERLPTPAILIGLHTVGRLSRGVQIGLRDGFAAGTSLDHAYRDTAEGWGPLGRFLDRRLLNAPGWRAIRQRKQHLGELLDEAIPALAARDGEARLFDPAAGQGRYALEALQRHATLPMRVLLADQAATEHTAGQQLIDALGLGAQASRVPIDALDPEQLAGTAGPLGPNLVVAAGFYELVPGVDDVRRSLAAIAGLTPPGGQLIYSNLAPQAHPQRALINRLLTRDTGRPLPRRDPGVLDALVAEQGFAPRSRRTDRRGIFSVTRAERG